MKRPRDIKLRQKKKDQSVSWKKVKLGDICVPYPQIFFTGAVHKIIRMFTPPFQLYFIWKSDLTVSKFLNMKKQRISSACILPPYMQYVIYTHEFHIENSH